MKLKQTGAADIAVSTTKKKRSLSWKRDLSLYLMIAPAALLIFYFAYVPMPGLVMSFMDYDLFSGFFGSPWVGFKHFKELFQLPLFTKSLVNTVTLSFLNVVIVAPAPVIFALLLNEIKFTPFKKTVQTVSYLPHFISWIAVIGMANTVYSTYGIINDIRVAILGEGAERIRFLASQGFLIPNVVILTLWKGVGWSSIIYLAAISGIDSQLYEAAEVDGANRFQQCINITVPSILPTAVMLLVLQIGNVFRDNFDLIYGLQNPYIDYETISTVVFKQGIQAGNYSMSTAIGFFQGGVGFLLVVIANKLSKKINDVALW